MRCPYCNIDRDKVIDSRPLEGAVIIRRRRVCTGCKRRFTTYERFEETPLIVIKSDNRREEFSRDKLREGITRACEKRSVSTETIEKIVSEIEYALRDFLMEVKSSIIGEKVLKKLATIDEIAYIRFASVYHNYQNVDTFLKEIRKLKTNKKQKSNISNE